MSLALTIKVNDGVILASDSAATLGTDQGVTHVYNHANKILNLQKGLPIGVVTWGKAGIGNESMELILKDLRKDLKEKLDNNPYTIDEVANHLKTFVYDGKYRDQYGGETENASGMGFMVCGYSTEGNMPEEYILEIKNGGCEGPKPLRNSNEVGITWRGEGDALHRLLMGYKSRLPDVLRNALQLDEDAISKVLGKLRPGIEDSLITPAMPLQDAIDLAKFLVNTAIQFAYFTAGAPTVGGPIEIAAITKHEGFKWVERKHYFSQSLNPGY